MVCKKITPNHEMMVRISRAFHEHGYDALTMASLADACQFTRRALYHYFSSKEEVYRGVVRHFNNVSIKNGLEAGAIIRLRGGGPLDILAETINVRYGDTRRGVSGSPHLIELNSEVFRRCHDIMIDVAIRFNDDLAEVIRDLATEGLLYLRPGLTPAIVAQLLTDGARGVNQSRPPIRAEDFATRYRQMTEAILFGCALQRGHDVTRGQHDPGTVASSASQESAAPSPGRPGAIRQHPRRTVIGRR